MDRAVTFFDKIGSLIPGYSGYVERDGRRQCDKILRESIASKLASCEKKILKQIRADFQNEDLTHVDQLEECRNKTNTLLNRIKYAPYGESAFFSSSVIAENELLEIYKKDLKLMENVQMLHDLLKDVKIDGLFISDLVSALDDLQIVIDERNGYIKEFK